MFVSDLLTGRGRRSSRSTRYSGSPSRRSLSPRRLRLEGLEDRQLLSISGLAFNDLDADGLKDAGESGQSGWTIYLDANSNGQLDGGETATNTAADGSYRFDGLPAGTYTVAEVQQPGWQQTTPVGTAPAIERVSLAADGTQANGESSSYSLSADARYVAFSSAASNLVPDDTNGVTDLFVYDRQADTIERVSLASDGTQANSSAGGLNSISADGRYVAFFSKASNLVPGDTNGDYDVFVYDRQTDTIERVSLASDGTQGNGTSYSYSLSDDGRYVAFWSFASNLVPGDTNGVGDVFVYDRQTDTIERVSLAANGTQGDGVSSYPSISADGRYVAFQSTASNLVPGDTNGTSDTFVYDRQTDTIERVSLAANGTQANGGSASPSISDDGRYVAFFSFASNLCPGDTNGTGDVFVYDRQTDTTERVSLAANGTQGDGVSSYPSISADGRYVGFYSIASNLVPGDTNGASDIFVYDRQTDTIERVSLASDGTQGNGTSASPSISADGRYVAFNSNASNLVPSDSNGFNDIFVTANPFASVSGSHVVALADGQDVSGIDFGNTSLSTKFYVVNDAAVDRTYEYNATGTAIETYSLNTGNTAPRGAASTIAGDRTWVVDANRKVYVYDNGGELLGSWTAGTLASNAVVEGIATNGTDIWIVDANSDKVFRYTGAASRLTDSQNAASSFKLNSSNTSPKDIVTDGTAFWVVNDNSTDKVFKYTVAGKLLGSWTISSGGGNPTGITIDPSNASQDIWIVDSSTDKVYQYTNARSRTSLSQAAAATFPLAAGNTNPQGIADPPAPGSAVATSPWVPSTPISWALDAALDDLMDARAENASPLAARTAPAMPAMIDFSSELASPAASAVVIAPVASTKTWVKTAERGASGVHAVDQAITILADCDLKTESALQSLVGSRG